MLSAAGPGADSSAPPLDTPCLVAIEPVVTANIARLQEAMDRRGVALRPHAKTHKSVEIAQRQIAAGAVGITVGTIGEAEVFAAGGIDDIFLAYPVWASAPKRDRLRAVRDLTRLTVGVDSERGAAALGAAVPGVAVLIEIDCGGHRSGAPAAETGRIVTAAQEAGLEVRGVFTHGGHSYAAAGAATSAAEDEVRELAAAVAALRAAGIEAPIVSAGSTPTATLSAAGVVTEERPGTYVFGDRQQVALGSAAPEDVGLYVATTVVSVARDHVVLDCGAKSLSKDRPSWLAGHGLILGRPDLEIRDLYDYHAVVPCPPESERFELGAQVLVMPNHVCPVVNLFPHIDVLVDGEVVDRWRVDAQSRTS